MPCPDTAFDIPILCATRDSIDIVVRVSDSVPPAPPRQTQATSRTAQPAQRYRARGRRRPAPAQSRLRPVSLARPPAGACLRMHAGDLGCQLGAVRLSPGRDNPPAMRKLTIAGLTPEVIDYSGMVAVAMPVHAASDTNRRPCHAGHALPLRFAAVRWAHTAVGIGGEASDGRLLRRLL